MENFNSAELYLKPLLAEMQPKRVLIIGREVRRVIEPILSLPKPVVTIPQPTAFLSAQALRNLYKDVYQVGLEALKNA